jgi:tRNA threonylcarbamoyladenosine biosynthesis protein TsaE
MRRNNRETVCIRKIRNKGCSGIIRRGKISTLSVFYLYHMEWQFNLDRINAVAEAFWQAFDGKLVFAFTGNLGAGKTTFIKALCAARGVEDRVTSPTFSIINEYRYPGGKIYHLDLYRLKDEGELIRAGVEECFYSRQICLVEWPELAAGLMPADTQFIEIETIDPDTRKIRVSGL